jgi:hypothetical protein
MSPACGATTSRSPARSPPSCGAPGSPRWPFVARGGRWSCSPATCATTRRASARAARATRSRARPRPARPFGATAAATCPTGAARSRRRCATGRHAWWPPPMRSSSAWTSAAWMRWCWPGIRARARPRGSAWVEPGGGASHRWAVLVLSSSPLDQFVGASPSFLLDKVVEQGAGRSRQPRGAAAPRALCGAGATHRRGRGAAGAVGRRHRARARLPRGARRPAPRAGARGGARQLRGAGLGDAGRAGAAAGRARGEFQRARPGRRGAGAGRLRRRAALSAPGGDLRHRGADPRGARARLGRPQGQRARRVGGVLHGGGEQPAGAGGRCRRRRGPRAVVVGGRAPATPTWCARCPGSRRSASARTRPSALGRCCCPTSSCTPPRPSGACRRRR